MKRKTRWLARWSSFLTGICIGLLIVAPVLASPQFPFADAVLSTPTGFVAAQSWLQSLLSGAVLLFSAWLIHESGSRSPSRSPGVARAERR